MGGNITRYLALRPGFFSDVTLGQGNVHKVITIDTPHLGTPLAIQLLPDYANHKDANECVRNLLASKGNTAFGFVFPNKFNGSSVSGAVGDLQGDGFGDTSPSPALTALKGAHRFPTALIAGVMNQGNLDFLSAPKSPARLISLYCGLVPRDPLALDLTPTQWPTVFGQDSDGIVPLASQLHGLSTVNGTVFDGYIHSAGTAQLGFGPPIITKDGEVQVRVIDLLNTPVTDPVFNR